MTVLFSHGHFWIIAPMLRLFPLHTNPSVLVPAFCFSDCVINRLCSCAWYSILIHSNRMIMLISMPLKAKQNTFACWFLQIKLMLKVIKKKTIWGFIDQFVSLIFTHLAKLARLLFSFCTWYTSHYPLWHTNLYWRDCLRTANRAEPIQMYYY